VRSHTDISVAQDRNPPFMLMSNGSVRNAYTLKLRNMESRPREMEIALAGLDGAAMWTDEMPRSAAARSVRRTVPADATETVRAYVIAPAGTPQQDFAFLLRTLDAQAEADTGKARFAAPGEQE